MPLHPSKRRRRKLIAKVQPKSKPKAKPKAKAKVKAKKAFKPTSARRGISSATRLTRTTREEELQRLNKAFKKRRKKLTGK